MLVTLAVRIDPYVAYGLVACGQASNVHDLKKTRYLAKACFKRVSYNYGREETISVQFYTNFIIQSPKKFMPTAKTSILY